MKKIYLTNIKSALKTIAPKGTISINKFVELVIGLGIECTD
jgi:hypothetical protein